MASDAKTAPGGHYSGRNPVPNIQRFVESLDRDKKARDAQFEAQSKVVEGHAGSDVKEHSSGQPTGVKGTRKTVTDPTTGKNVQIEDVNADFLKAVDEPFVSGITQAYSFPLY
jgi:hypothetical protein